MLRRFFATLGFLSRLAPARVIAEEDMRRAMFHLPLCGLVIGVAVCAPALAGFFAGRPLVQAWTVVLLSVYFTRGLHLDGLSDVMDGAAQHTSPERFWTIVKDSRCGTFGVGAVVLALLGQTALFAEVLGHARAWMLPWVFVFGRACGVCFGGVNRAYSRPGLGGLFLSGADAKAVCWALLLALGPALWLNPLAALYAVLTVLVLLTPLYRLVRAVAGVNGDFLGASIIMGELAAAAGLVLTLAP
ncbi:MAG: adenosylcobinamide-GDP ribazoletransferase [Humidesulfovibrio sp.]|nr:adenosylcobinamide-GDP ribazoletransferase [Humidesulfovibrio sp.]